MQKENKELREELSEVRDLYQGAERARQQVPALQNAVEDYKRVLEKVEQEHYELQQMKKQLEFDNKALAKRWDEANDQHMRDQDSIADLSDKLRTLGGSPPATPAARENGGLESELTGLGEKEQRLRTRLSEQGKENERLRSVEGELQAELCQLQQTLSDLREGSEDRERQRLANYEKMLILQSSLTAVQQGQNIHEYVNFFLLLHSTAYQKHSTESYRNLLNKLDKEQQSRVKLEFQTQSLMEELETSRRDCKTIRVPYRKSVEQHIDYLSVSLVDMDKRTILSEVKQSQNAELTNLQDKHKVLKKKMLNVELDLAGHRELLRNNLDTRNSPASQGSNDEILQSINSLKDAMANRPTQSVADFERDVALLGEKILQSNAALAKTEEVFRNSHTVLPLSSVKGTQPLSSSSQQQTTNPKRQSFASKFSKVFTTGKANSKTSNTAYQEAERRNSRTASLSAASSRPKSRASSARSPPSREDSK